LYINESIQLLIDSKFWASAVFETSELVAAKTIVIGIAKKTNRVTGVFGERTFREN
jgi:hypothetical protein